MNYTLSSERISTFAGNVFPLWLKADDGADISKKDITFSCDESGLLIRDFKSETKFSLSHGVLITVLRAGTYTVTATVEARPMHRATSEEATEYYLGDMHTHTTMIHDHDKFAERTVDFPEDYLAEIKKENLLDFGVISDHAETLNDRDFLRSFIATEEADAMRTLIFPGAESEVVYIEKNRFGVSVRKSG